MKKLKQYKFPEYNCFGLLSKIVNTTNLETKNTRYIDSGIESDIIFENKLYKLTISPERKRK